MSDRYDIIVWCVRLVGNSRAKNKGLAADVLSAVFVGVCFVATLATHELISTFPVGLGAMAANWAGSRCIPWIDEPHWDASHLGLVHDLVAKVSKRPGMKCAASVHCSPYPGSNALEVFKSDAAPGAFGDTYQLLCNSVIDVGAKSPFFAAAFSEEPPGGAGANGVESCAKFVIAGPQFIEMLPSESSLVTCCRYFNDAKIDAEPVLGFRLRCVWNIDTDKQKMLLISVYKVRLASVISQHGGLFAATGERYCFSATGRPYAYRSFACLPGQYARVVGDGAKWFEFTRLLESARFVGVSDLGYTPDNAL